MNKKPTSQVPHVQPIYLLALVMVLLVALLEKFELARSIDQIFFDFYIRSTPLPVPDDIIIIAVDEKSLSALGQWPWRRSLHAQLVDTLAPMAPTGIVFDILFTEPDKLSPRDDEALARSMAASGNVIIPVHIHPVSNRQALEEIPPIPILASAAVAIGHAHVELDSDGISRGLYLHEGMGKAYWPALSLALMNWHLGLPQVTSVPRTERPEASPYINVRKDFRLIRFSGGPGSLKTFSYIDVLSGAVPAEAFQGKFVFVGATAAGLGDFLATPVSGQAAPMSGVEFHANAFNVLKQNQTIEPVSSVWQYLLSIALVLMAVLTIPRIKPERTLPAVLLILMATLLFSLLTLVLFNQWYRPMAAVISIMIVYPLWTWRRIMQLSHFLNQELAALADEPRMARQFIEHLPPERILEQVTLLVNPKGWVLFRGKRVALAEHYEGQRIGKRLEPGYWLHEKDASWFRFDAFGESWTVGLFWDDNSMIDRKRAFLHRVPFPAQHAMPKHRLTPTSERLQLRIAQVQDAIANMQHMRRFVSEGFARMPDGVIVTDPLGGIIFHNEHARTLLECPPGSLKSTPLIEVLSTIPDTTRESWQQIFRQVLLDDKTVSREVRLQHTDILLQFAPFIPVKAKESGMIVNLSDITHLKEEQRKKNEAIDFLSHDLRSPLVSQLALLDRIERNHLALDPELIGQIRRHAERSMNLAEQFLQVARAEQVQESAFYECDLITILFNALDASLALAKEKRIQLIFDPEMDDAWTRGNPELLERLIINLLTNAIKYSPAETSVWLKIAPHPEAAPDTAGTHWVISVEDEGPGIPEDEIPMLFESFRRGKQTELEGVQGAGLGLRFVKIVADKHGGTIDVVSEPGKGCRFIVTLPALGTCEE